MNSRYINSHNIAVHAARFDAWIAPSYCLT